MRLLVNPLAIFMGELSSHVQKLHNFYREKSNDDGKGGGIPTSRESKLLLNIEVQLLQRQSYLTPVDSYAMENKEKNRTRVRVILP